MDGVVGGEERAVSGVCFELNVLLCFDWSGSGYQSIQLFISSLDYRVVGVERDSYAVYSMRKGKIKHLDAVRS